jgi:hypothetical protein
MAIGLVGVYLGANQSLVTFVGPLARLLGPHGTDIGFELGIVFAGIAYFILRRVELQTQKPQGFVEVEAKTPE